MHAYIERLLQIMSLGYYALIVWAFGVIWRIHYVAWRMGMQCGFLKRYKCAKIISLCDMSEI